MADLPALTILCPTRNRPENALELLEAFKGTSDKARLVFIIDSDDPKHDWYYYHLTPLGGEAVTVSARNKGMAEPLNEGFNLIRDEIGFAVGFFGDDVRPRTKSWDTKMIRNLRRMKTGLVYGDDQLQGEKMATHPILTTDIIDTLGWFALPTLNHLCVDTTLQALATEAGCISYMPSVVLEHLHPANGKAKTDEGYAYCNSERIQTADGRAYRHYLENSSFTEDVNKIKALRGK